MATPPKSRPSKTGVKPASPVVGSSPTAAKRGASEQAVQKSAQTGAAPTAPPDLPINKAPAAEPAVPPRPEQPLSQAAEPQSVSQTLTSEVADNVPLPKLGKSAETKGEKNMTDVLENAKTYAEETKTNMQSAFSEVNEKTKTAMEKSARAFEELGDLTRGNFEAMVESSRIAAKGVETMSQDAAEFGRKSFEKTSATMKSFAGIKSPAEFFQLQSELMSQCMDSFASETARNSEKMLKLANEVSQPISNRVSVVAEKIKTLAA